MTRVEVGPGERQLSAIQLAVADPDATEIVVWPGTYEEQVVVAPRERALLIRSETGDPRDVIVTFGLRQGDLARDGMPLAQDAATMTLDADDTTLRGITVVNSFDRARRPGARDTQSPALRTRGDRIRIERCRLLGQQDTLLLDSPSRAAVRHVLVEDCEIRGDVDVIYGRATAVVRGGTIHATGPGYVAAPSTIREVPRGLLFSGVRFTADAPDGSVFLARPWHQGGSPEALGSAEFAGCALGAHVAADPFADMGGFSWRDARFRVHAGPGPSPESWLAGWDGPPAPTGRVVIVSDSTASAYGPERAPRTGWGQVLADESGLEVVNAAVSGASTRSFLDSPAADEALASLSPGDALVVAFGHNDAKPGPRHADVPSGYPAGLRRFLAGARARRAIPVIATPVERRGVRATDIVTTHDGYPQRARTVAREEGVPLLDLSLATRRLIRSGTDAASRALFLHLAPGEADAYPEGVADDTHLSERGARAVARIVAGELRALGIRPRARAAQPA
ncbi:pectinesterase family protein [Microbacterium excoecariae]|uniref:pectinesterase family protein n=1 Tax=Microbacterium excoecariae TaxID=2715210 RepID=UPI00140C022C|nr:pectinesterase family protein [Microbacterium excoecariae]NHI17399.1 hypothetical protein [Microbacterium excoecariae]